MATINLSWTRNSAGGTPLSYKIYRKSGSHVEESFELSGATFDAGFPITVSNITTDDANPESFSDTDNADTTNVNTLFVSKSSGTHVAPAAGSTYSYTVTAISGTGVESAHADNANALNITA
jgi:fibronectin type 3 domain-containing protein